MGTKNLMKPGGGGGVRKKFAEHMDSVGTENGQKQIFQRVCKFFPKYFLLKDFLWMPFYALTFVAITIPTSILSLLFH